MAKIKGTNGDDTLVGTSGDDTITPLLGIDSVDGGAGYDVLTIDYSGVTGSVFPGSMTLADDGTWSGGVSSGVNGGPVNAVGFDNVERIVFKASQDIDYITVDLGTLALDKTRLRLDGGGGDDVLVLDASRVATTTALTLAVATDGAIQSNVGALANWDAFDIALGKAAGNTVTLGAGDDRISSIGGTDTIDGGAGYDSWTGDYQSRSDSLVAHIVGDSSTVSAASGTVATITNVEQISFGGGSADDIVNATHGAGFLNGGGGYDTLYLDKSYASGYYTADLTVEPGDLVAGQALAQADKDPVYFRNFESIVLRGEYTNVVRFDGSESVWSDQGYAIAIDGVTGYDFVTLDLQAQSDVSIFATGKPGDGELDWGGGNSRLFWNRVEELTVNFGAGDDSIMFDVARKALAVDGGAGFDTIDFSGAKSGVFLILNEGEASNTGGISLATTNMEGVIGSKYADLLLDSAGSDVIAGGDGDDTIRATGASGTGADTFNGGNGRDTIEYSLAASGVAVSLAATGAQSTGGAGTNTLSGFEILGGSSYADVLTGSAGDDRLNGFNGDDVLEGGAGADLVYGYDGNDTASYATAGAAITVSLAITTAQNTGGAGTDTFYSIENLIGSAYGDALTGDAGANRMTGGRGGDTLVGGGGADVFVYSSTLDSNSSGYDRISDFSRTQGDKVDLSAIDAISNNFVRNDTFTWIGDAAFSGVAGQLREVAVRGGGYLIQGDVNGDRTADLTIFVDASTPLLPNSDIVL